MSQGTLNTDPPQQMIWELEWKPAANTQVPETQVAFQHLTSSIKVLKERKDDCQVIKTQVLQSV